MIVFSYRNAWAVDYTGSPLELSWLKSLFTYKDFKDFNHKKRFGYFPEYCTVGEVMSHGQVIHAIREARKSNVQIEVRDSTKRYMIETGRIPENYLPDCTGRDYQLLSAEIGLGCGHGIFKIGTGGGKCLGLGTKVLMYDGTTKSVETVVSGDRLMGPDSQPRTVLSTCRGFGPLYQITPVKGNPWVCNDVHVLTLKHTSSDKVIDIPLDQYQNKNKKFKHCHKQFSVGINQFPDESQVLPIDPYFLGIWLGDGTKNLNGVVITKEDPEIVDEVHKQADIWSLRVRTDDGHGTKCQTHHLVSDSWDGQHRSNPLLNSLRSIFKDGFSIPLLYLTSTRQNRLQLLAGLLDTDGYLHNGSFEIVQKRREIADGILHLSRSLGFKAIESIKTVDGNPYIKISICGEVSDIPTRIPRKQAQKRKQKKDACRTGFSVQSIGPGEYAGFELDGDGRFLLGDFTVTHNTVIMGMVVKKLVLDTDCKGIMILILSKDLLNQTAERFVSYGVPSDDIGIIHSDISAKEQQKACEKRVILSTHLSIPKFKGTINRIEYVICDECHKSIGPLWSALFPMLPNLKNILGFTATPWDDEGERQKMLSIYGQVIVDIPVSWLISKGHVLNPEIYFIRIHYKDRNNKLIAGMDWRTAEKQFILEEQNRNLLPIVVLKKFGGRMLVLYNKLDHGERLEELYIKQGFETRRAEGTTSTDDRKAAIEWFEKPCSPGQHGKVLLASRVFDEGIDIKGGCDIGFLIGAGQDASGTKQRVGRLLRKNATGRVRIFEVQDTNHPILSKWSGHRRKAIREETGIDPKVISLETFANMTDDSVVVSEESSPDN